jgi:hypothetical protein
MITGPNRIRNIKSRDSIAALMVIHYVPGGIRTPDPRLRRALLYPAELLKQERFIIYHNYEEDASPKLLRINRHFANKKTLIQSSRFFFKLEAGDGNRTHAISLEG